MGKKFFSIAVAVCFFLSLCFAGKNFAAAEKFFEKNDLMGETCLTETAETAQLSAVAEYAAVELLCSNSEMYRFTISQRTSATGAENLSTVLLLFLMAVLPMILQYDRQMAQNGADGRKRGLCIARYIQKKDGKKGYLC